MLNYAVLELSSFSNGAGLYNGNLLGQGNNIDAYSAVGADQALKLVKNITGKLYLRKVITVGN